MIDIAIEWGDPPALTDPGEPVVEVEGDNDLPMRWAEVVEANRLTWDHWEHGEEGLHDALAIARIARSEGLTVDENTLPELEARARAMR